MAGAHTDVLQFAQSTRSWKEVMFHKGPISSCGTLLQQASGSWHSRQPMASNGKRSPEAKGAMVLGARCLEGNLLFVRIDEISAFGVGTDATWSDLGLHHVLVNN